jgi:hypothetical protein
MLIGLALISTAVLFTLLSYIGSRETSSKSAEGEFSFRYQRTLLIAFAISGVLWSIGSVALLVFCFDISQASPIFLVLYAVINCIVVFCYAYGFIWYKNYVLKIGDEVIIVTLRGHTCLRMSDVYKAQIIEGKDSTRMVLFIKGGKKINISGFLRESNVAFEMLSHLLSREGCDISRRSYFGHWTSL